MNRCPRTVEAARFEFLAKEERTSFTRHAAKCDACRGAFELLHDARTILRENTREPDANQLRALRLGVDAKVTRRRPTWIAWPVAAAAAALCAALFLWPSSPVVEGRVLHAGVAVEGALPPRAELVAEAGTQLVFADAALAAPEGATFAVDLDPRAEVRVLRGAMRFDVAPRVGGFWVSTPHTTIRVVGTRFTVRVLPARTELSVEEGVVEATEGARVHRVEASQSIRIPRDVAVSSAAAGAASTAPIEGTDSAGASAPAATAAHDSVGRDVRAADSAPPREGSASARDGASATARGEREASAARARDVASATARAARDGTRDDGPPPDVRSTERGARDEPAAREVAPHEDERTTASASGDPRDDAHDEPARRSADGAPRGDARDDATARSADGEPGKGTAPAARDASTDRAPREHADAPSTDEAPPRTPKAWLDLGDERRRADDFAAAADAYANAATSPALAEEALYRRAEMLGAAGDLDAALALLASSQRRFGASRLGPERAVLTAQLAVDAGRYAFAAQTLEAAGTSSFAVRSARLTIGARLVNEDAALARRVVAPLLGPSQARSIRIRAHVVAIRAAHEARDVDDETALRAALEKIEADE